MTEGRWTVSTWRYEGTSPVEGRGNHASMVTAIGDTFKGYGKRQPTP